VPIISAATATRHEGYFRLEWDLADQRSHMIARNRSFIVPVCVDRASGAGADVPESFQRVQWTLLPGGECSPAFVGQIAELLAQHSAAPMSGAATPAHATLPASDRVPSSTSGRRGTVLGVTVFAVLAVSALGYLALDRLVLSKRATAASAAVAEKSIAVLPFADMSEKHDQEYFADGMAEELIDRLGQISELRVISRTSAFQFKGKSEDVRAIGAKLSVANVLEDSVRRSGDQLRVDVKLVAASDGTDRWSQRYDRRISDIFQIQDEIATEVALALKGRFVEVPDQARTESNAAHNFLLEGRFLMERWASGDDEQAISAYQRALGEDPSYALAWTELSWAEMWANPPNYDGCAKAALHAIELRPDSALAHATRGWCESLLGFDLTVADMEFNKALALEPNNLRALYGKGRIARIMRKNDDSLRYYQVVLGRDPVNPFIFDGLSTSMLAAGRTAEAVQAARKALDFSPNLEWGHWYLAYALLWNHELDSALREIALEPIASMRLSCAALIERARGNQQASEAALRALLQVNDAPKPYMVAEVYGSRGDTREALDWLERARLARTGWFSEVTQDPAFNAIREDSAFKEALRRMKLPE
jgi:TolB-like protein